MTNALQRGNDGQLRSAYVDRLSILTDVELASDCDLYIWLSAYAANNPRSDYHWKCAACFDECKRRGKPYIYSTSWKRQANK